MLNSNRKTRAARTSRRNGTAAVECAIITPLLVFVILGAIDMGQFANIHQKVSDASREGARVAARNTTKTTSEVQAAVMDYLAQACPGTSSATLAGAATVTVSDSSGNSIAGGALDGVPSGAEVRVQVTLQFESVRWIGGLSGLDGSQVSATTIMRRE